MDPIGIAKLDFYDTHAQEYFERTVSTDLTSIYDQFLPLVPLPGRILDIGCGSGRDLKFFKEKGFVPVGIDSCTELVSLAKEHSKAECQTLKMEELDFCQQFEGVWACASLLHLPFASLQDVVSRIHTSLVLQGVFYVSVKLGEGERVESDGRFFCSYQREEFLQTLESVQFTIHKEWVSSDALSNRNIQWLNVLARKITN